MHGTIMEFVERLKITQPDLFRGGKILECGSYDINGTVKNLFFSPEEYTALDWREGPGVNVVSLVHLFNRTPNDHFDVVISTSMLEHDPYWRLSIRRMLELLKVGGSIILTCASPSFHVHEVETSPEPNYYRGLSAFDVGVELMANKRFVQILIEENPAMHDVCIFASNKLS